MLNDLHRLAEALAQVKRNRFDFDLPRLNFRKVEYVVDDREQRFRREPDETQMFALLGREIAVHHQFCHAENAVHGRANFVAHRRQERAFGFAGRFGGFLGALQFDLGLFSLRDVYGGSQYELRLAGVTLQQREFDVCPDNPTVLPHVSFFPPQVSALSIEQPWNQSLSGSRSSGCVNRSIVLRCCISSSPHPNICR